MSTENNPLDMIEQITKKIEENRANSTDGIDVFPTEKLKWLVCTDCKHIYTHDLSKGVPPTTCPECNSTARQHVALSEENAKAFAEKAKAAAAAAATPAPVQETPEPEPPKKPRAKKAPAAPTAPVAPAPAPAPSPVELKDKEEWQRHIALTVNEDGEEIVDYDATHSMQAEWLTKKYALNTLAPSPIGVGVVYAQGLRAWMKDGTRKDITKMETDTPAYWRELYESLRTDSDVSSVEQIVLITDAPEDLTYFTRGGRLVLHASLRNGRTRISAPTGSKVKLGAFLSKRGSLVWVVMGVISK